MSKSHLFLTSLLTFCLGIGVHTILPYSPYQYGISAILFLLTAVVLFLYSKIKGRENPTPKTPPRDFSTSSPTTTNNSGRNDKKRFSNHPTILTIVTVLTFLPLGIYRGQSTIHIPSPETIDYYTSETKEQTTIQGIIAEEPDVRRDKINYTIEVKGRKDLKDRNDRKDDANPDTPIVPHTPFIPTSGYTLISANKYPAYHFGDTLEITGNLQKPAVFDSFDYAGYLSRFDIYSVMYRPGIQLLESPQNNQISSTNSQIESHWSLGFGNWSFTPWFFSNLLQLKSSFEHHLNKTFPTEPTSSFMAGLLLGSRKGMPEELTQDFQTTGLTHIVAISGYNITLIVSILMAIFKPFGKRISILLSALGIIIFTLFVGATPAVVRACIMGLIALLALNSERKGNITIILALTVAIMIGYNPKILIHDVGFQLSFLATMGLVYVSPILEPSLKWLPKKLAIRDSINLSLSAQIMALPIIVLNFHNLSIISPISNLLVAGPIIPFSMLFGFAGTITSYISLALAKLIAFPGYLLLQYIVQVIEFTADIPYAAIQIGWFSQTMLLLYFISLSGILLWWWKGEQQRQTTIHQLQLVFEHRVVEELWLKNTEFDLQFP